MVDAARGRDPLLNVIEEGGPYHVRHGQLDDYLVRLRETGRSKMADQLKEKYVSMGRNMLGSSA